MTRAVAVRNFEIAIGIKAVGYSEYNFEAMDRVGIGAGTTTAQYLLEGKISRAALEMTTQLICHLEPFD